MRFRNVHSIIFQSKQIIFLMLISILFGILFSRTVHICDQDINCPEDVNRGLYPNWNAVKNGGFSTNDNIKFYRSADTITATPFPDTVATLTLMNTDSEDIMTIKIEGQSNITFLADGINVNKNLTIRSERAKDKAKIEVELKVGTEPREGKWNILKTENGVEEVDLSFDFCITCMESNVYIDAQNLSVGAPMTLQKDSSITDNVQFHINVNDEAEFNRIQGYFTAEGVDIEKYEDIPSSSDTPSDSSSTNSGGASDSSSTNSGGASDSSPTNSGDDSGSSTTDTGSNPGSSTGDTGGNPGSSTGNTGGAPGSSTTISGSVGDDPASSVNGGEIAGIVIGSVILFALIVIIIILAVRKKDNSDDSIV